MINVSEFIRELEKKGISFFSGVPDSLLKEFCSYLLDHKSDKNHVITANEGGAIALSIGYYLSTGHIPLVYMQNSGLGNAINPLLSLVDSSVYSIPLLLCIGWRGEPGVKDEPQHYQQGKVTLNLLDLMNIPYSIISGDFDNAITEINKSIDYMKKNKSPYALVFRKNAFDKYKSNSPINPSIYNNEQSREDVVKCVVDMSSKQDFFVSTTGMLSRELYEYRETLHQSHSNDFLTVGGMGHASQIAAGIAINKNKKNIICLDGDGAMLMHLGSMVINSSLNIKNLKHIVINNGAHDSVGGQPTRAKKINLTDIAKSFGYHVLPSPSSSSETSDSIKQLLKRQGPVFLEIKVKQGARSNLGRPSESPIENCTSFMNALSKEAECV